SAALETLSFVLGMLRTSFQWLAGRVYPSPGAGKLATVAAAATLLGLALSGCGGGKKPQQPPPPQRVRGAGYSFEAPAGWLVQRTTFVLHARREYELTCRFPAAARDRPLNGACARLLASFRLTAPPA